MERRRFTRGRVLVLAIFLVLIVLGHYFGVLKTPTAGGLTLAG